MHNKKFEWNAYSICDGKYYKFFQQVYGEYYVFLNNITCEDKLDRKWRIETDEKRICTIWSSNIIF